MIELRPPSFKMIALASQASIAFHISKSVNFLRGSKLSIYERELELFLSSKLEDNFKKSI